MKKLLLVITISISFASASLRQDIRRLSDKIYSVVDETSASASELTRVKSLLRQSLDILYGDGFKQQECIKYAYEKYYLNYNAERAMDAAFKACKKVRDLEILKLFYNYNYKDFSASASMDLAQDQAGFATRGKIDLARYMIEKYYLDLNGFKSAAKTAEKLPLLTLDSLKCLKFSFDNYYRTLSAVKAMDKAVLACR